MKIDTEKLRRKLMDYYGTAMMNGMPMSVVELGDIKNASAEELFRYAQKAGIDIDDCIMEDWER